jgi:hypothetical protein
MFALDSHHTQVSLRTSTTLYSITQEEEKKTRRRNNDKNKEHKEEGREGKK